MNQTGAIDRANLVLDSKTMVKAAGALTNSLILDKFQTAEASDVKIAESQPESEVKVVEPAPRQQQENQFPKENFKEYSLLPPCRSHMKVNRVQLTSSGLADIILYKQAVTNTAKQKEKLSLDSSVDGSKMKIALRGTSPQKKAMNPLNSASLYQLDTPQTEPKERKRTFMKSASCKLMSRQRSRQYTRAQSKELSSWASTKMCQKIEKESQAIAQKIPKMQDDRSIKRSLTQLKVNSILKSKLLSNQMPGSRNSAIHIPTTEGTSDLGDHERKENFFKTYYGQCFKSRYDSKSRLTSGKASLAPTAALSLEMTAECSNPGNKLISTSKIRTPEKKSLLASSKQIPTKTQGEPISRANLKTLGKNKLGVARSHQLKGISSEVDQQAQAVAQPALHKPGLLASRPASSKIPKKVEKQPHLLLKAKLNDPPKKQLTKMKVVPIKEKELDRSEVVTLAISKERKVVKPVNRASKVIQAARDKEESKARCCSGKEDFDAASLESSFKEPPSFQVLCKCGPAGDQRNRKEVQEKKVNQSNLDDDSELDKALLQNTSSGGTKKYNNYLDEITRELQLTETISNLKSMAKALGPAKNQFLSEEDSDPEVLQRQIEKFDKDQSSLHLITKVNEQLDQVQYDLTKKILVNQNELVRKSQKLKVSSFLGISQGMRILEKSKEEQSLRMEMSQRFYEYVRQIDDTAKILNRISLMKDYATYFHIAIDPKIINTSSQTHYEWPIQFQIVPIGSSSWAYQEEDLDLNLDIYISSRRMKFYESQYDAGVLGEEDQPYRDPAAGRGHSSNQIPSRSRGSSPSSTGSKASDKTYEVHGAEKHIRVKRNQTKFEFGDSSKSSTKNIYIIMKNRRKTRKRTSGGIQSLYHLGNFDLLVQFTSKAKFESIRSLKSQSNEMHSLERLRKLINPQFDKQEEVEFGEAVAPKHPVQGTNPILEKLKEYFAKLVQEQLQQFDQTYTEQQERRESKKFGELRRATFIRNSLHGFAYGDGAPSNNFITQNILAVRDYSPRANHLGRGRTVMMEHPSLSWLKRQVASSFEKAGDHRRQKEKLLLRPKKHIEVGLLRSKSTKLTSSKPGGEEEKGEYLRALKQLDHTLLKASIFNSSSSSSSASTSPLVTEYDSEENRETPMIPPSPLLRGGARGSQQAGPKKQPKFKTKQLLVRHLAFEEKQKHRLADTKRWDRFKVAKLDLFYHLVDQAVQIKRLQSLITLITFFRIIKSLLKHIEAAKVFQEHKLVRKEAAVKISSICSDLWAEKKNKPNSKAQIRDSITFFQSGLRQTQEERARLFIASFLARCFLRARALAVGQRKREARFQRMFEELVAE